MLPFFTNTEIDKMFQSSYNESMFLEVWAWN